MLVLLHGTSDLLSDYVDFIQISILAVLKSKGWVHLVSLSSSTDVSC